MRTEQLTATEQQLISDYYRKNKIIAPLWLSIGLIVLVIWLFTGSDIREMHWAVAGVIALGTVGVTLYTLWRISLLRRDAAGQVKLVGSCEVTGIQADRRNYYVWINDGKGRRLHLTRDAFSKLRKGATYHFEITPHARTVVKIVDGAESIYEIRSYRR